MQSVNEVQFFNITYLPVLFVSASAAAVYETVITPLRSIYASL